MKRVLLFLVFITLISCTKKVDYDESHVVGSWSYNSDGIGMNITYREDSTFTLIARSARSRGKMMKGTWYVNENRLITNHVRSKYNTFRGEVEIVKITDSIMITRSDEGVTDTTWRDTE